MNSRRRFVAKMGALAGAGLAGCTAVLDDSETSLLVEREYWREAPSYGTFPMFRSDSGHTGFRSGTTSEQSGNTYWRSRLLGSEKIAIDDGTLFFGGPSLRAMNGADGSIQWSRTFDRGVDTPAIGEDELVTFVRTSNDSKQIRGLDKSNGTSIWRSDEIEDVQTAPVIFENLAFAVSQSEESGELVVTAVARGSGEIEWRAELPRNATSPETAPRSSPALAVGTPCVSSEGVFIATNTKVIKVDIEDGTRSWEIDTYDTNRTAVDLADGFGSTREPLPPNVSDGKVYAQKDSGAFAAWDADAGEELWEFDQFEHAPDYSSSCVDGETLFVAYNSEDRGRLVALDSSDGSVRWHGDGDRSASTGRYDPLVTDTSVYVPSREGLAAVDKADGSPRWSTQFPSKQIHDVDQPIRGAPVSMALANTTVYVRTMVGDVVAIAR